jgi:hypothetical protein
VAAPERDVGDDRVFAPHELGLESLRELVIQQSVPPMAGDVLGQHDDGDRGLLVGRPSLIEDVEVGDER